MLKNIEDVQEDIQFYNGFVHRLIQSVSDDGRTPHELSKATGIKSSTIIGWMQGRKMMNIFLLVKLADELCISIDWLLGRKEDERL